MIIRKMIPAELAKWEKVVRNAGMQKHSQIRRLRALTNTLYLRRFI
jgi:hypothetical protein